MYPHPLHAGKRPVVLRGHAVDGTGEVELLPLLKHRDEVAADEVEVVPRFFVASMFATDILKSGEELQLAEVFLVAKREHQRYSVEATTPRTCSRRLEWKRPRRKAYVK